MSNKPVVIAGLIVTLAILLVMFIFLKPGQMTETQKEIKEVSEEIKTIQPVPTILIPAKLKYPLTSCILEVLNVYLSAIVETTAYPERKKSGPALDRLKQEIVSLVEKTINDPKTGNITECREKIRNEVSGAMDEAGRIFIVATGQNHRIEFYKPVDPEKIIIAEVKAHPGLLAVTTEASTNCGNDDSFYLFQKREDGFKLVMKEENTDTKDFGRENLRYAISSPENPDEFFVVLSYTAPWCTSNWKYMDFQVLKPGVDPEHPKVILADGDSVFVPDDIRLNAGKNDFILEYSGHSLDAGLFNRKIVRHYAVKDDKAEMISPVAYYPEDFIDAWMHLAWEDAKRFCSEPATDALKAWHARFENSKAADISFGFIQPCNKEAGRWEIGMETSGGDLPAVIYFEVEKIKGDFILKEIRETRTGDCPGETPPAAHDKEAGLRPDS